MDQNNDHPIPDSAKTEPSPPNSSGESRAFPETFKDSQFSIKISEDMVLRNLLRTGLVEAQGKDGDLIPLYVSWPHWLEDGIVCMYVKDFHKVIYDAVKEMAMVLENEFSNGNLGQDPEHTNRKPENLS